MLNGRASRGSNQSTKELFSDFKELYLLLKWQFDTFAKSEKFDLTLQV